jgi:hypothetical protein
VPEGPWKRVLLHEDFEDGDYSQDPAWTVVSGDFRVDSDNALRTKHAVTGDASSGNGSGSGDKATEIVGKVVGELLGDQKEQKAPRVAEIYSQLQMGTVFALQSEVRILSDMAGQGFELAVYRDRERSSGYLLRFSSRRQQSLALVRMERSGSSIIDTLSRDGLLPGSDPATITWLRYGNGDMKVLVGGKELLRTRDRTFESFEGIAFINRGGSFALNRIDVLGPQ